MANKLKQLITGEQGQGMTEYGLVLGVIAVAIIAVLITLRGQIAQLFNNAVASLQTSGGTTGTTTGTTGS